MEPPCNCRYINQTTQTYLKHISTHFFSPSHRLTCYEHLWTNWPLPIQGPSTPSIWCTSKHDSTRWKTLPCTRSWMASESFRELPGCFKIFDPRNIKSSWKVFQQYIAISMPSFKVGTVNLSLFEWDFAILLSFWGWQGMTRSFPGHIVTICRWLIVLYNNIQ